MKIVHLPQEKDGMRHLRAGHTLRAYWKAETVGYVHLANGFAEVFDTAVVEELPTEEIFCSDCEIQLDLESVELD